MRARKAESTLRTALVPVLERSRDRAARLSHIPSASGRAMQQQVLLDRLKAGKEVTVSWVHLDAALDSLGMHLDHRHGGLPDAASYVVLSNGEYQPS